jgi:hypothetical protein
VPQTDTPPTARHPHPFYPWPRCEAVLKTNLDLTVQDGPFAVDDVGWLRQQSSEGESWPGDSSGMAFLAHKGGAPLMLIQNHPLVGMVAAQCSFTPAFFPVWGNQRTFSWEPYFERTVAAEGEMMSVHRDLRETWWIDYEFGESPGSTSKL